MNSRQQTPSNHADQSGDLALVERRARIDRSAEIAMIEPSRTVNVDATIRATKPRQ